MASPEVGSHIPTVPQRTETSKHIPPLERELFGFLIELQLLRLSPIYRGVGVEQGHGQPVMVIPGFLGSDLYLDPMNRWLTRCGYQTLPSHISNFGDSIGHNIESLLATIRKTHHDQGTKTILIGHSLGGEIAFYLQKTHPDLVGMTITLGSPLVGNPQDSTHPIVWNQFRNLVPEDPRAREMTSIIQDNNHLPEDAKFFSIYTRQDGVIDWRACLHPQATNIEVHGTHSGLAWNAEVFTVIAQLLAKSCVPQKSMI